MGSEMIAVNYFSLCLPGKFFQNFLVIHSLDREKFVGIKSRHAPGNCLPLQVDQRNNIGLAERTIYLSNSAGKQASTVIQNCNRSPVINVNVAFGLREKCQPFFSGVSSSLWRLKE